MKTKVLLDKKAIERTINRITHEIIEKNEGSSALSLIGIRTRGIYLANRIQDKIKGIEGIALPVGVLDITMYRDDISKMKSPDVKKTDIPFDVNNMTIILVDDVMHTGRTTRAAIDAHYGPRQAEKNPACRAGGQGWQGAPHTPRLCRFALLGRP